MKEEHFELWFLSEVPWAEQVVAPKEPWDKLRPTSGLVRELFDIGAGLTTRKVLPTPLDDVQAYLIGRFEDSRRNIDQLIQEASARAQLHDQSVREIDYQIGKAASFLDQFSTWGIGYNTGVDVKRNSLERELANLRRERRNNHVRAWEDITRLRKEFREALAEYKSLLSRLGML